MNFLNRLPILFVAAASVISASGQISNTKFTWTDNGGNNNWVSGGNWSQDPGAGDYPGEKSIRDFVYLDGSKWGSGGTNHFDIDLTTPSSDTEHTIAVLSITTDGSTDAWAIQNGPQDSTIKIIGDLIFKLDGGGSATMDNDLYISSSVSSSVVLTTSGNRLVLNGSLRGSSDVALFGYQSNGGGITLKRV